MCQGLTRSYGGLLACRFIMGILEAALPPGKYLRNYVNSLSTDQFGRRGSAHWAIL